MKKNVSVETEAVGTEPSGYKRMKIHLTFDEGVLGTASNNPTIHSDFIASKAPDAVSREEEIAAIGVEAAVEESMTIFPRNENGELFLYDYQIKGFFKDACASMRNVTGSKSSAITSYKKKIDQLVFVFPRKILLNLSGPITECERPLRAFTAQGERIALSHSEEAPAGTEIEFEVLCMNDTMYKALPEWLNYGALRGIGQWRNSGKGRFHWEEIA